MTKIIRSEVVPRNVRVAYATIVALTDAFCRDHLDDEYGELARRMAAALCRKRISPVTSGQPRTWACAIICVLGRINFLSDRSVQPYMTMADVCIRFGVGRSTASAKARVISQLLKTHQPGSKWTPPRLWDANPLVWMAKIGGTVVDLRHMQRDIQEFAFRKGMIPYIPADRTLGLPLCSRSG